MTVEVNPFLTDLIAAKLSDYDPGTLARSYAELMGARTELPRDANLADVFGDLPETMIEPGVRGRWVFDGTVACEIASFRKALLAVEDPAVRRLFRVLLGGLLLRVSNVTVSGKGRRYRRNWQERPRSTDVWSEAVVGIKLAMADVHRFRDRPRPETRIVNGDARRYRAYGDFDLAVFSPPYPNSFDYTDVYNVELWMLGYLRGASENQALRKDTLSSHVQISIPFPDLSLGVDGA